jgi:GTP cyclohydrolase I
MANDLAQIVAEKMQALPIEEQQKVVEFVQTLGKEKRKSLLEKIPDRVSKLSDETLEKLPIDGAENLDHYLYCSPKKN